MRNVAIVGVGMTKHVSKRRDVNIPEMVYEAVEAVFQETGLAPKDIDAFVTGNMPAFEGINTPELWGGGYWGAYRKPVIRITTGGSTGASVAQGAIYAVASGVYDTVLTLAFEKQSDGDTSVGLNSTSLADFANLNSYGATAVTTQLSSAIGLFVYQATSYMHKSGLTIDQIDKAAAMLRRNAAKNPYAHLKQPNITAEDIAKTPMISYPLRFGHTCPASDGAVAMIFTTKEKAKKITRKPAWVKGLAACSEDGTVLGQFGGGSINIDPAEQRSCKFAAQKAYKMAGITNPEKEIQVAEPYIPFGHQLFIYFERLFLCKEGDAPKLFDQGVMDLNGAIPICPSGGVMSNNAIGAAAMVRIAECALQIMQKAGEHQVTQDVHTAVAHGLGGSANLNVVTVLGDSPN